MAKRSTPGAERVVPVKELEDMSPLQVARLAYVPRLPASLAGKPQVCLLWVSAGVCGDAWPAGRPVQCSAARVRVMRIFLVPFPPATGVLCVRCCAPYFM